MPGPYLESCTSCKVLKPSESVDNNYFIQCGHCTKDSGTKTLASLYVDDNEYKCSEAANQDGKLVCTDKTAYTPAKRAAAKAKRVKEGTCGGGGGSGDGGSKQQAAAPTASAKAEKQKGKRKKKEEDECKAADPGCNYWGDSDCDRWIGAEPDLCDNKGYAKNCAKACEANAGKVDNLDL